MINDVEIITYQKEYLENNEVCDAIIKEWETDSTKKKENFPNNVSSEYRNKSNRDENANRKSYDAQFEKKKEYKTPNRGNYS